MELLARRDRELLERPWHPDDEQEAEDNDSPAPADPWEDRTPLLSEPRPVPADRPEERFRREVLAQLAGVSKSSAERVSALTATLTADALSGFVDVAPWRCGQLENWLQLTAEQRATWLEDALAGCVDEPHDRTRSVSAGEKVAAQRRVLEGAADSHSADDAGGWVLADEPQAADGAGAMGPAARVDVEALDERSGGGGTPAADSKESCFLSRPQFSWAHAPAPSEPLDLSSRAPAGTAAGASCPICSAEVPKQADLVAHIISAHGYSGDAAAELAAELAASAGSPSQEPPPVNEPTLRSSATTVNLGFALSAQLRELAAEHSRDFAGEARAAVRFYLEAQGCAPTQQSAAQTTAAARERARMGPGR